METVSENIINVQEIEPRLRHQTIFNVFNTLKEGEHLIIHNNHDPQPVFYQLMNLRGNIFSWEYLQSGPQWWDIKVTRQVPIIQTENESDIILNIPAVEPHQKHGLIFHIYENLEPGETFIIHNDHDPKPLYYQLKEKHGDVFSWEYLNNGPQWWDIRITLNEKKAVETNANEPTNTTSVQAKDGERIVDVPSLEPRLKHPTIFKTFDALQAGESMIIHNDHDPKPVYYQLQSEKGDCFTWEYLQQGPQWWDIRVTKKEDEIKETIGEIVAKDINKTAVFKKYGIDFCCNGNRTVREACTTKGIDYKIVEAELKKVSGAVTGNSNLNYDDWSLGFLADYIVNTHHHYVRKFLPEIVQYMNKVAQVHGPHHPELADIKTQVDKINTELTAHMVEEENVVFPLIKEMVNAKKNNIVYAKEAGKTFSEIIEQTEKEHDSVGRALEAIRQLNNNYEIPQDACTSYTLLYKMLEEFENDTFIHIHLENNILFVKAKEMEKNLLS
ncbi:MAG: iron-sulfur cluster repair di-iron protein [Bacteroidetes bacterium]|nr:iron-sulfur cluster repair di-iron protein [Bacteroidota bacterium]